MSIRTLFDAGLALNCFCCLFMATARSVFPSPPTFSSSPTNTSSSVATILTSSAFTAEETGNNENDTQLEMTSKPTSGAITSTSSSSANESRNSTNKRAENNNGMSRNSPVAEAALLLSAFEDYFDLSNSLMTANDGGKVTAAYSRREKRTFSPRTSTFGRNNKNGDDANMEGQASREIPRKTGATAKTSMDMDGDNDDDGVTLEPRYIDLENETVEEAHIIMTTTTTARATGATVEKQETSTQTASHIYLTLQGDDESENDTLMGRNSNISTPPTFRESKSETAKNESFTHVFITLQGDEDVHENEFFKSENKTTTTLTGRTRESQHVKNSSSTQVHLTLQGDDDIHENTTAIAGKSNTFERRKEPKLAPITQNASSTQVYLTLQGDDGIHENANTIAGKSNIFATFGRSKESKPVQNASSTLVFLTLQGDDDIHENTTLITGAAPFGGRNLINTKNGSSTRVYLTLEGDDDDDSTFLGKKNSFSAFPNLENKSEKVGNESSTRVYLTLEGDDDEGNNNTLTGKNSNIFGYSGRNNTNTPETVKTESFTRIHLTLEGDDDDYENNKSAFMKEEGNATTKDTELAAKNASSSPPRVYLTLEGDTDDNGNDMNSTTNSNNTEAFTMTPPASDGNNSTNATMEDEHGNMSGRKESSGDSEESVTTTDKIPVIYEAYDTPAFHGRENFEIQDDFDVFNERGCIDFRCKDDS